MTVAELIDALRALPADMTVVMPSWEHEDLCSPTAALEDTVWKVNGAYQLADERDDLPLTRVVRLFDV